MTFLVNSTIYIYIYIYVKIINELHIMYKKCVICMVQKQGQMREQRKNKQKNKKQRKQDSGIKEIRSDIQILSL